MQVISSWDMYWITRLDYCQRLCVILTMVFGFATMFTLLLEWRNEEEKRTIKRYTKGGTLLTVLAVLGACLVPNTKEYAAIKIIPAIANSEDMQNVGEELVNLGKEWLIELRPTKKEGQ